MSKNVRISLYVEGFEEDPEVFATRLGVEPDEMTKKGVVNPGRRIASKFSSIQLNSKLNEEDELNKHVQGLLNRINDLEKFKKGICESCNVGINTVIYIDEGDVSPKCAMFLTNDTLKQIADLGCEIDFDIYG
ncbi:MAG: DUF4279 domain-containing protein [Oligoflexales bacterium]